MEISGEQLEQAIQQVVRAVKWSEPPKSDTVAPGDFHVANAQSVQLLVLCAREAMKQKTAAEQEPIAHIVEEPVLGENLDELADVSKNGDT